ncbi:MAG: hypothetical protein U0P30_10010 [Vicinamibacterales bacterium]
MLKVREIIKTATCRRRRCRRPSAASSTSGKVISVVKLSGFPAKDYDDRTRIVVVDTMAESAR